jgi:hypothetical protein
MKNKKTATMNGVATAQRVLPWVLALGLGCLGTWQFHSAEFYSGFDLVPGGRGDPRLVTALLEYFFRAWQGIGSFTSPFFYYPAQGTLGYTDAFFTHALLYSWLRAAGLDLFSSYQVCLLFFNVLNFVCCFLLLRKGFGFGTVVSAFGAFIFAFNAPKFNQIGHTQLQCLFWLPLAVWACVAWIGRSRSMAQGRAFLLLAVAAICLNFQFLTAFYFSWFLFFWLFLFFLLSLLFESTRTFGVGLIRKYWRALLGAAAVFLIGLIPFLGLYLPVLRELGGKDYGEVAGMVPNLWSFLWMGPRHAWWGWLSDVPEIRAFPVEGEERLGMGIAISVGWILLTLLAVWLLWSRRGKGMAVLKRPASEFADRIPLQWGALAAVTTALFCLLGFDYGGGFSPWRLIHEWVPGAQGIRAVSRYVLFLAFPLAILFSFAAQVLLERLKKEKRRGIRWMVLGILWASAGTALWEQTALPPFPAFSKSWELNRMEYLSQKLPAQCQAFYVRVEPSLPYTATDIQLDAMILSAVRGVPTLNGYSGHSPPDWGLYKVRSPRYPQYVQDWINLHQLKLVVCGLWIDR